MKIFQLMLVMTLGLAVLGDEDNQEMVSESVPNLQRCPVHGYKGWSRVGSYCAKHFHQKLSFGQAENECRTKHPHGHLISVQDGSMNNKLRILTGRRRTEAWIGGYKIDCAPSWLWTDGSKWCYQNWVPGEPNNSGRCAQINWHTPGKFDDTKCCNKKTFVCAFPIDH